MKLDVRAENLVGFSWEKVDAYYIFYKRFGKGPHWISEEKREPYDRIQIANARVYEIESLLGIPFGTCDRMRRIEHKILKKTRNMCISYEKILKSLL